MSHPSPTDARLALGFLGAALSLAAGHALAQPAPTAPAEIPARAQAPAETPPAKGKATGDAAETTSAEPGAQPETPEPGPPAMSGASAAPPLPEPAPVRVPPREPVMEAPAPEPAPVAPPPAASPPTAPETAEVEPCCGKPSLSPIVSMMTRFEKRAHYDDVGRDISRWRNGDRTAYRARFGLRLGPLDVGNGYRVIAVALPQASGFLDTSGGVTDAAFDLHEGYMQIKNGDTRLDVGRMEFVYGDHLVIGNLGWHQTARAFDAMRLHLAPGDSGAWLDLFLTQVREGMSMGDPNDTGLPMPNSGNGFDGDHYFMGAYADLGKLLNASMNLDAYLLAQLEPAYEGTDAMGAAVERSTGSRMTIGARAKDAIGDIDYRIEAGAQFGSAPVLDGAADISRSAFQVDGELGVNLGQARVSAEGFMASGDDPDTDDSAEGWTELYPTTHKWLGLTDVMGVRTNVAGGALHLAAGFAERWKVAVDGHVFTRPQATALPGGGRRDAGYAGTEVDTGLVYVLGKGLKSRAMYGVFMPGDIYSDDADPVHYLEIELSYNLQ